MSRQLDLEMKIIEELKTIYDPEIPVNIYDLGLVYKIEIENENHVNIEMTLTSPNCPAVEFLPEEVKEKIESLEEINSVKLDLVWDPPFTQDMMSEEAKLSLGLL